MINKTKNIILIFVFGLGLIANVNAMQPEGTNQILSFQQTGYLGGIGTMSYGAGKLLCGAVKNVIYFSKIDNRFVENEIRRGFPGITVISKNSGPDFAITMVGQGKKEITINPEALKPLFKANFGARIALGITGAALCAFIGYKCYKALQVNSERTKRLNNFALTAAALGLGVGAYVASR